MDYSKLQPRLVICYQSKTARGLISASAGFIVYGGWAYYANLSHPYPAALKAAVTQGSYSFILTLCMTLIMEWLFNLSRQPKTRFYCTFIITCLLLYGSSWGINAWVGTPEILFTILPGAIVGTLYTLSYSLTLLKLQQSVARI